jgi:hypothetical protein
VVDEETFDCADAVQHRRTHHLAFQRKIRSDQEGTAFSDVNLRALLGKNVLVYRYFLLGWVEILVPKPKNHHHLGVFDQVKSGTLPG